MLRREEPQMLAALNGLVFAGFAAWSALGEVFDMAAAIYAGLSLLFWIAAWFAGRHELRPLIAAWVLAIGAYAWLQGAAALTMMKFGIFLLPLAIAMALPFAYLALGLIVSIILYRETRAQRTRPKGLLLERPGRR